MTQAKAVNIPMDLLRDLAGDDLVDAAARAVESGTHRWDQEPAGNWGLVEVGKRDPRAVIVVYPGPPLDFEVDDKWMERMVAMINLVDGQFCAECGVDVQGGESHERECPEWAVDQASRAEWDAAEDEIRGLLDEAQIHLQDAVDALMKAEGLSRSVGGPYWLHGQLEAYTIPTIRTFAGEERYQPGTIGGLQRSLDEEEDQ